jgi:NAD(P)-dependent dehydrogenase (short-subunit alcohol dehydrogenase family)
MGKLSGKIAVITGGNSGIGLETARLFAKEGAKVVITGRRQKELDEAVKSIGDNVMGVPGDVSNLADLDKLYAKVKEVHAASTSSSPTQGSETWRRSARSPKSISTNSSAST